MVLQLTGLGSRPDRALTCGQCSEAEKIQCVLSCLNVDAIPEPGILVDRGDKLEFSGHDSSDHRIIE